MVVVALGITWVLDGLEVTIVGALSGVLQSEHTLHLSSEQIGTVASCYVAGAVLGAIVFGWLTDRFGRRTMFYVPKAGAQHGRRQPLNLPHCGHCPKPVSRSQ
jgi:MFS family permease